MGDIITRYYAREWWRMAGRIGTIVLLTSTEGAFGWYVDEEPLYVQTDVSADGRDGNALKRKVTGTISVNVPACVVSDL